MITGGYVLELCCMRCPNPNWLKFQAINEKMARREARMAGWKFTNGDVLCPTCAKESEAK